MEHGTYAQRESMCEYVGINHNYYQYLTVGVLQSEHKKSSWCAHCTFLTGHTSNWGVRKAITVKSTVNAFLLQRFFFQVCFNSQSKTVRLQSKNGNILTLARKKDTQIVSRYLLRCEWRRKKTAPTKKIMNGIVWCSKYVFVDSFTFFGFLVSLSFRRNNTGRCGIKAQSVKYCLISSAIEQWHWMKYFQWDKL